MLAFLTESEGEAAGEQGGSHDGICSPASVEGEQLGLALRQ